jgi:hypothetical protein
LYLQALLATPGSRKDEHLPCNERCLFDK